MIAKFRGGAWQGALENKKAPEFIIAGKKTSKYDSFFQAIEDFKRLV